MADFCKQCAEKYLGIPNCRDLARLGDNPKGLWSALCEGCGFTVVDYEGNCVYEECKEHGVGCLRPFAGKENT